MYFKRKWLTRSTSKVWEGFLQNIGVIIAAFIFSGSWLIAIKKVQALQKAVRQIPTDYVLTPLILLMVVVVVLLVVMRKQRAKLEAITKQPRPKGDGGRLVTHCGVWWMVDEGTGYIEDFPYCPCCEKKKKLIQTEWYPDEVYRCPATGTEIKLFDEVPRKRRDIIESLYRAYCKTPGEQLEMHLFKKHKLLRELHPDEDEQDTLKRLFRESVLSKLPDTDKEHLLQRFPNYHNLFSFLRRNFDAYAKHLLPEQKTNTERG